MWQWVLLLYGEADYLSSKTWFWLRYGYPFRPKVKKETKLGLVWALIRKKKTKPKTSCVQKKKGKNIGCCLRDAFTPKVWDSHFSTKTTKKKTKNHLYQGCQTEIFWQLSYNKVSCLTLYCSSKTIFKNIYYFNVLMVVIVVYCVGYIILLCSLYHFNVLNVKIKPLMLDVL